MHCTHCGGRKPLAVCFKLSHECSVDLTCFGDVHLTAYTHTRGRGELNPEGTKSAFETSERLKGNPRKSGHRARKETIINVRMGVETTHQVAWIWGKVDVNRSCCVFTELRLG